MAIYQSITLEATEPLGFGVWVWSVCPAQAIPVFGSFRPSARSYPAGHNRKRAAIRPTHVPSDEERTKPP